MRARDYNVDWMKGADCVDRSELFYPLINNQGEDYWLNQSLARSICQRCPHELRCKDYAVAGRETEGIWGNTDADDRRKIRLKNIRTFPDFIQEIRPAIEAVAASYVYAQEVLDAKSKMQTMPSFSRERRSVQD